MTKDYAKNIENALKSCLPSTDCREKKLIDAMAYSLEAGGKRVRPYLVFSFNSLCGGSEESATAFACAFETLKNEKTVKICGTSACCRGVSVLSKYAGATGMIGGQVIDLMSENTNAPIEVLREMDYKKTACLIKAACELGCISAGANDKQIKAASEFGECIGIAFQIQDDILDVTSSDEELGKPVGSDAENSKSTYVSLLGIEKCRELVDELTEKAVNALHGFDGDTKELEEFAYKLAKRNK